jgi:hypothetical protein
VRRGASWTAAYHLQLTVAAVARPVPSGVDALGVLAAERSWWLLAQTTFARRSVQPGSRGRASSPWSTRPAATPRRRSPVCPAWVSTHPVSVSGIRLSSRPVSGHLGSSSSGSGARPSAVHPSGVQPSGVCPRPSGRVRLLPCSGGGVGKPRSRWPGDRDHRTGGGPCGYRAVDGSTTVQEAGTRATLPKSRWSGGGRWRTRAAGWVRAAAATLAAERPGRPGRRAERPSRAAARWARERAAARGGGIRHLAAVLGWGRDHGTWSSPSLTAGWAAPEGPLDVPAGMGVRPQRGPSRQRTLPARCRQRSDLRRWVVGLPGLEPGTSSLSAIEGSPLCGPAFSQVAADRRGRSNAF